MEAPVVACVVGARPNFVKIAPIMRAFAARGIGARLIHTGQHYDTAMNAVFFDELRIPPPDIDLEIGSDSASRQIARIMLALDEVFAKEPPALVLVVGDVNTTLAAALVASKRNVPLAHVEAGLRSRDRSMPEEVNRVLTDSISDLLFTTEESAIDNLTREGIDAAKVSFVGNVMIDSLLAAAARAVPAGATLEAAGAGAPFRKAAAEGFGLVTLHRPSNVDDPARLREVFETLAKIAAKLPLVFPLHPRTRAAAERAGLMPLIESARIFAGAPLGYLAIVGLMRAAKVVVTDSGGVQEETTALGVPCLTVRPNTERPITIAEGTNTLVGTDPAALLKAVDEVLAGRGKHGRAPRFWDGRAAERIADRVAAFLAR